MTWRAAASRMRPARRTQPMIDAAATITPTTVASQSRSGAVGQRQTGPYQALRPPAGRLLGRSDDRSGTHERVNDLFIGGSDQRRPERLGVLERLIHGVILGPPAEGAASRASAATPWRPIVLA